ncbi:MAG: terminase small subunit [Carnobacterium sp.]|uniref:terminase small subunit n=1 Tax=Carnobacterium sp. TaxID=48221 RepID=UPI003C78FD76
MNWEAIRIEFEETDITMKALAEKHGVKPATLRSRKTREDWQRNATNKVATKHATKRKKVATKINNVATKKAIEELEDNAELNDKQKLFCLYFSQFNNATKAYQKAYECSYGTAQKNSWSLMANQGIRKEVKRIKEARSNDWLITDADIINEWVKQAFIDVTDYTEFGIEEVEEIKEVDTGKKDEQGYPVLAKEVETYKYSYVNLKNHTEIDGTVIQEVSKGKYGVSVKFYDKQKALIELRKLTSRTDELNNEFTKKRIQKLEEEIKLIKGKEPDTSLMKLLLNTVGEDNDD